MNRVFLNLGSNIDPQRNIDDGLEALAGMFGFLRRSPIYQSDAVGFDGPAFYNLAVALETELGVAELAAQLRALEHDMGRPLDATRFSSRTLDIDILTFNQRVGVVDGVVLPREEILYNAHVLCPLADLAPDDIHPVEHRSYAALWAVFDKASQPLLPVE